jgi:hypothetical protein
MSSNDAADSFRRHHGVFGRDANEPPGAEPAAQPPVKDAEIERGPAGTAHRARGFLDGLHDVSDIQQRDGIYRIVGPPRECGESLRPAAAMGVVVPLWSGQGSDRAVRMKPPVLIGEVSSGAHGHVLR